MKPLTKEQLFELFDKEVHNAVENLSEKEGVDHLVVFENLQMDSSCFGDSYSRICEMQADVRPYLKEE